MTIFLQVQINIVLSILLFILLGHSYSNINRKKITNRLVIWIIGLTWVTLILETLSVLLNSPNLRQFIVLHKLVNIIGFIVTPTILFLGYIFSKEWANRYQKEKIKVNNILLLPLIINGIGTLISHNGGGIFHVSNENIYERGPLFFILPCVSYTYFAYNLYFIYKHRKKFTNAELVIFSSFNIIPALFTSIQLKYSAYLTTWTSTAIIIVIGYIFILNDQAYRDSLTGLENRLSYDKYTQNIGYKKLSKLFAVYIDIDGLKTINDQYGHYEGDEAIKAFASLLHESFPVRQKKLIRLGGDEFLILLERQPIEKVVTYIQNLTQCVETYNNKGEKPFRLSFSYGMAGYTKAYKSIYQLLEYADQLMYLQKQNRKNRL
ncbi:GGDEF domain-containing protein [Cellulosilyticum sp. I15G10I2]|uniref:GGDEF domain-containing protein n=1 Tax=Cellulosilyticum sp. I15G10I2 TaxID=1892843 RepID=UPI0009F41974|nr:GGDEF domain-containing protein [Cellulosilyticum sp. I15G10I2]